MTTNGYLLDTNAISETRRKHGHPQVAAFFARSERSALYLSVLTLGELRRGAEGKRRRDEQGGALLTQWIDEIETDYADRVIPVDTEIARLWGELSSDRSRTVVDTLFAATAIVHGLTLVTRNTADVDDLPVKLLNPWLP